MKIDLKRLRSDVTRLKAARTASPIGKVKTGATEVIRKHFLELERMHYEDGASWAEIAEGLAKQGVTQGDGLPLTGRRLTALMHNIRVRIQKLKNKPGHRDTGGPLTQLKKRPGASISIAPELADHSFERPVDPTISEETIRRAELSKHAHLLRRR